MSSSLHLIILAGGAGVRIGRVGRLIPKPLITVYDEPLIVRQLRQAREAGLTNISIYTKPNNYKIFTQYLNEWGYSEIKIIKNSKYQLGLLSALASALPSRSKDTAVVTFGDIYYLKNPFIEVINTVKGGENTLGLSKPIVSLDLQLGGVALVGADNAVRQLIKQPIAENKRGWLWNGLATFPESQKKFLHEFIKEISANVAAEEYFEWLITKKKIMPRMIECPFFVNANNLEEMLLASLYRYAEVFEVRHISSTARRMRNDYLRRKIKG